MATVPLPKLGSKLDSAIAKLDRSHQHLRLLDTLRKGLEKRKAYALGVERYDDTGPYWHDVLRNLTYQPIAGGIMARPMTDSTLLTLYMTPVPRRQPRIYHWGAIVGDIVHNLSSALDHLVFELAQVNPNPPALPKTPKGRELRRKRLLRQGFPYVRQRKNWAKEITRCCFFLDRQVVEAGFEETQPFYAWEKFGSDPNHHPLWVLRQLWNRDKHRSINLTVTAMEFKDATVRIPGLVPHDPEFPAKAISPLTMRPIEGKTEIAVMRVQFPQPVPTSPAQMEMHVNAKFALGILFGDGTVAKGDNVFEKLQAAGKIIEDLLYKFR